MLLVDACLQTPSCLLSFDVSINLFLLAHGGGVTDGNGGGAFLIYWVVVGLGDVKLDDGVSFWRFRGSICFSGVFFFTEPR